MIKKEGFYALFFEFIGTSLSKNYVGGDKDFFSNLLIGIAILF